MKTTILIMSDDKKISEVIRHLAAGMGDVTVTKLAREMLENRKPDLAIIDARDRPLEAMEIVSNLRKMGAQVAVMVDLKTDLENIKKLGKLDVKIFAAAEMKQNFRREGVKGNFGRLLARANLKKMQEMAELDLDAHRTRSEKILGLRDKNFPYAKKTRLGVV